MATITIRHVDEQLKARFGIRSDPSGRSMEGEVGEILQVALNNEPVLAQSLIDEIRALVEPFGGVSLELPSRNFSRN
jgi:antitoxin FitA